jgi:hypothetical protein
MTPLSGYRGVDSCPLARGKIDRGGYTGIQIASPDCNRDRKDKGVGMRYFPFIKGKDR